MRLKRLLLLGTLVGTILVQASFAADSDDKAPNAKEVKLLLDLTNQARAKEKLPPLKVHELLTKAAMDYSKIMAKDGKKAQELMTKMDKASHTMGGKDPLERLDDIKYNWLEAGENVACALRIDEFKSLFDRWMKSKHHHDNIVNPNYKEIGIAIYKHPDRNEWYITQLFGVRDEK